MVRRRTKPVPPPPAAEPAMSGTTGSGAKGDCGPPGSAPPRRPRSRTGVARAAGEAERTRGARCATPFGTGAEKKSCVASTAPDADGRASGPAAVPPVDDDAARGCAAGASAIGESMAGEAGLSDTAMGVASSPGTPGLELVPAAGSASAAHVQFHTQFQPARGAAAGAVRHAPVQFHTQVQVAGSPDALAPLGEALAAGALAPSLVAPAAG